MPKKLCCCKEDLVPEIINPNWIAIPCKEYANHVYKKTITQSQFLWPNQTSSTTTILNFNPLMWDAGITYPWYFADTPNYVSFDKERPVFVMQRGGGGGGKTGDSISSAAKGGNAAYVEVIIPADRYWATIISSGGSTTVTVKTGSKNYVIVDPSTTSVITAVGPAGSDAQIQFNNSGAFGGITNTTAGFILTSNGTTSTPSFQVNNGITAGKSIALTLVFG